MRPEILLLQFQDTALPWTYALLDIHATVLYRPSLDIKKPTLGRLRDASAAIKIRSCDATLWSAHDLAQ